MNELINTNEFNIIKSQETFINYLDVSNKTISSYKNGIECFISYLRDNNATCSPTRENVIGFRNYLKEQKYANNTINSYMVAIRSMFKFLSIKGIYPNIAEDIKGAKVSSTPKTQVLPLNKAREMYASLTDPRERVIFGLLITTGLRGTELSNAMLEDIKIHNNEIVLWVQCKGHTEKDEYVKLSEMVLDDIKKYIGNRTTGYLIVGHGNKNNGGKVTTKTIRDIVKGIFKRFDLDYDYFSLHTLRRSSATISYELGADVKQIQQVLHHQNLNTTMRYINACTRDNNKMEFNLSNAILG